jgi:hypothetical protein
LFAAPFTSALHFLAQEVCNWRPTLSVVKYPPSLIGGLPMKIGFSLPNIGPIATAEAITKVAQRAEELGYSSLWTIERLLWPLKLQRPYPGTPDGSLPEIYRRAIDPVDDPFCSANEKIGSVPASSTCLTTIRSCWHADWRPRRPPNGRLSAGLGLDGTRTKSTQPAPT